MRLGAVALATSFLLGTVARSPAALAEIRGLGLRLEAGVEHDTNPERLETLNGITAEGGIVASPAAVMVTQLDAALVWASGWFLTGTAGLAGKRFWRQRAQGEDLVIADGRLDLGARLGSSTGLALGTGYYDVYQRASGVARARDFRSLAPALRVEQYLGPARISLSGGWRHFVFKPAGALDFSAPTLALAYQQSYTPAFDEAGAAWDWSVSFGFEHRRFPSGICTGPTTCEPVDSPKQRRDAFFFGRVDLARIGDHLLGVSVAGQSNASNSFGQSLLRVSTELRAVFLLPGSFSLAARGELVATRYDDLVPVGHNPMSGTFVNIEDESRSTLRVQLSRPVWDPLEAGARYTLYSSAPSGGPAGFSRQVFLLFVAVTWGG